MNFTILGAGTWGITLNQILENNGHKVSVWHYKEDHVSILSKNRVLEKLNVTISKKINFIYRREDIKSSSFIIIALPSQTIRATLCSLNLKNTHYINTSKGIELGTGKLISTIIKECTPGTNNTIACLSGPSHAEELIKRIPTVLSVGSYDSEFSGIVQNAFSNQFLRVYKSDSIEAMQVGGAVKNIISIAAGISIGLGHGDNTIAALITRGIQEIIRFAYIYTDRTKSLLGISGIGDLIVTATSGHSRNKSLGISIGKGNSLKDALNDIGMIAEGVETTESVYSISKKNNISMPICNQVYHVLFERKDPEVAIEELMCRELKSE